LNDGSFGDCALAGAKGVISGGITGAVGGVLAPIGGAGMSFAENLALGIGEGALTGGISAALSGDNIGQGMLIGAAAGAVFTTLTSENMKNLAKGEGFYTNKNVFNHMIDNGVNKQNILDYFGFKGKYDPISNGPNYVGGQKSIGYTDKQGNIFYGDRAFKSYRDLKSTYIKELYHSNKVLNGIPFETQNVPEAKMFPEERLGFINQYKNQGLYPDVSFNISSQIEFYQLGSVDLLQKDKFRFNWLDFIYKIPRRW